MTSPKLEILARQMARNQPERVPAPESGLGAAIEQLVQQAVQEQVADAIEQRKPPAHVRRLMDDFNKPEPTTDFRQIPPTPKAPVPKALEFQFGRDELGRINRVDEGGMQWYAQRNELGQITRMVPTDLVPPPPAIEPPALAASRAYQPPAPRT